MRRIIQSVLLGLFVSAVPSAPLLAGEADDIQARCEAEANEAGIADADEKVEYIKECIADLSQVVPGGSSND